MLGEFPDDLKGVEVNNEEQENISYAADIITYGDWSIYLYLTILVGIIMGLISIYYVFPTTIVNGIGELEHSSQKKLNFVHFSINLSKWQKFYKLSMQAINGTRNYVLLNGLVSVRCKKDNQEPVEYNAPIKDFNATFNQNDNSTALIPIFSDDNFNYDNIDVTVWASPESFTSETIKFIFEAGNQRFLPLEFGLRIASSLFLIVIAIVFWRNTRQYEKLSSEEKLTIFIIFSTILAYDPISLFYHGEYSELLTKISRDIYMGAFAYFACAIFCGFGDIHDRTFLRSFLPPASATVFTLSIIIIDAIHTPPHRPGIFGQMPPVCELGIPHFIAIGIEFAIAAICATLAAIAASRQSNEVSRAISGTERVVVYTNSIAFTVIAEIAGILAPVFAPPFIGRLTALRLLPGTAALAFALVMTHCHLRLADVQLLQPQAEFDPGPIGVEEDEDYLKREV